MKTSRLERILDEVVEIEQHLRRQMRGPLDRQALRRLVALRQQIEIARAQSTDASAESLELDFYSLLEEEPALKRGFLHNIAAILANRVSKRLDQLAKLANERPLTDEELRQQDILKVELAKAQANLKEVSGERPGSWAE
jgi:hypothetical protein